MVLIPLRPFSLKQSTVGAFLVPLSVSSRKIYDRRWCDVLEVVYIRGVKDFKPHTKQGLGVCYGFFSTFRTNTVLFKWGSSPPPPPPQSAHLLINLNMIVVSFSGTTWLVVFITTFFAILFSEIIHCASIHNGSQIHSCQSQQVYGNRERSLRRHI